MQCEAAPMQTTLLALLALPALPEGQVGCDRNIHAFPCGLSLIFTNH